MHPTIVLFDIDGTLIDNGGAGRRAIAAAFERLAEGADLEFSFAGMTDRAIVRQGLLRGALAADDRAIDRVIAGYLELLQEEVEASRRRGAYRVHPGIERALEHLAEEPSRFALGLGTGNVEPGARIKLGPSGLLRYFPFGGFGSDREDRAALLEVGARRGAELLGLPRERCQVLVVGDTPLDVEAALAIGARCVGVGTGLHRTEELLERGATAAFDDLSEEGALEALLADS